MGSGYLAMGILLQTPTIECSMTDLLQEPDIQTTTAHRETRYGLYYWLCSKVLAGRLAVRLTKTWLIEVIGKVSQIRVDFVIGITRGNTYALS